jgi:tetratricopeptide (TPR) repeat protein
LESLFVNWDDHANFMNNPDFRKLGLGELRWMLSTFHLAHYQPVTWLTWALDKALWGTNPFGYHLTNLLIHCGTAALFFLVCRRLLDRAMPSGAGFHPYAAAWAALVFAVHPLRVEAVAWATERRELLSAFFYLAAVGLYLKRHQADAVSGRPGLGGVLALGALAMLSNVRTVSLPLVLTLLDYHPLGRFSGPSGFLRREVWVEKAPFFLLALVVGVIGLWAQASTSALIPLAKAGFASRALQSCFSVGFHLWKTLAPFDLANWYGDTYMEDRIWVAFAGAAAVLLVTGALVWSAWRGRGRALLAAWFWYLLIVFPSLGIVKSGKQVVADRYSYLPSMSLAVLAAAGLVLLWTRSRESRIRGWVFTAAAGAALALLPLLAGLTWRQCRVWNDSISLWSRAYSIDPRSVLVRTNLGISLLESRRFDLAVKAFEAIGEDSVQDIDPGSDRSFFSFIRFLSAMAHHNWGIDLAARDRFAEAVPHFEKALNYNPDLENGHYSLGLALFRSGRARESVAHFEAAVKVAPGSVDARTNLAAALAALGRKKEAAAQLEAALRLAPDDPRALQGLSVLRGAGRR